MITLQSIQVGMPQTIVDDHGESEEDRVWVSGFFKQPIVGPVRVTKTLIEGDGQADLRNHGGEDKAILAYSLDHYDEWKSELDILDFPAGAFGENLSVTGTNETEVCIGDTWQIGDVRLQVSQPRQPCWKLGRRWGRRDLPARVIENGRSGWYLRVLQEGMIQAPATIKLIDRPCPKWTVAAISQIIFHDRANIAALKELANCEFLAANMRRWMASKTTR